MKLIITTLILIGLSLYNNSVKHNAPTEMHIAYASVNEDFSFGSNSLIDIDRDGRDDFSFTVASIYEEGSLEIKYLVHALHGHQILTAGEHVAILESDEVIGAETDSSIEWTSGSGQIIEQIISNEQAGWFGTWSGGRQQYVGLKLAKDGKEYYGWAEITVDAANEKATIVSYAINRVPGQSIHAGK